MERPDVLMIGPYPPWDMEAMESAHLVHRYWEAADKKDFVSGIAPRIRAIATRGSVVDEAALLDALEQKTFKGAGLDVFLNEPNIDPRFLALDNALLQPHHGSGTIETRRAMGKLVRDNLEAHFAGKPLLTPVA